MNSAARPVEMYLITGWTTWSEWMLLRGPWRSPWYRPGTGWGADVGHPISTSPAAVVGTGQHALWWPSRNWNIDTGSGRRVKVDTGLFSAVSTLDKYTVKYMKNDRLRQWHSYTANTDTCVLCTSRTAEHLYTNSVLNIHLSIWIMYISMVT